MYLIRSTEEINKAAFILSEAFYEAPNLSWMMKNNSKKAYFQFFTMVLHDAVAKKGAFLSSNQEGVLVFYDMENKKNSIFNVFRKIYVALAITGIKNAWRMLKHTKSMAKIRPKKGLLGMAIGTTGLTKSNLTAFEFKNEINRISLETQKPIFAETTNARVKKLYELGGFKQYRSIKHPYADVKVWFMKKEVTKA